MKERHFSLVKQFPIRKEEAWDILATNDHLNRLIGLFPVEFSDARFDESLFYRPAKAKLGGVSLEWKEYPFEWVKGEQYSVQRLYTAGPLAEFYAGIKMRDVSVDENPMTEVEVFSMLRPANIIGKLAIPAIAIPGMKKTIAYIEKYIALDSRIVVLPPPKHLSSTNKQALSYAMDKLEPSKAKEFLKQHIIQSHDQALVEMQPYKLADQWGIDREEVLVLFLEATKAGVLTLSWSLMCPTCRVAKESASSLRDVKNEVHCDLCGITYDMTFDETIELRFTVHPAVRKAVSQTYCIGGPNITPHILLQKRIRSGTSSELPAIHSEKDVRLRILTRSHLVFQCDEEGVALTYRDDGFDSDHFSIQGCTLQNESSRDIVAVVEEVERDPNVVTAANVTTMTKFRRLFSSEVLAEGQEIGVENVTIVFSDLRGSTSLYESAGDARAYRQVNDHFQFLSEKFKNHKGTIIKTIGDSVMAAFFVPENAVKAALDIQHSIGDFNAEHGTNLTIKLGMYTGPAIAVTANNQLDYFGHTVNMASRIEQESKGNDIMLSSDMLERKEIRAILKVYEMESYEAALMGIRKEVSLVRIKTTREFVTV
ncbi:adenylate/guanylate cyclase domain-containing protein [Alkalihalobacillus sp. CinArs1]|uniref:adenylate/guanylate cyclase domain-containing protein n=1 Tax=Alkalihalobacillus sp. CinArs1 TaxID=2995314 RepID=UPI0022DE7F6A|nr:adenylate/guanylate cyclase domain-containing protein [Alkalihalobacillus sp. CinArs1]